MNKKLYAKILGVSLTATSAIMIHTSLSSLEVSADSVPLPSISSEQNTTSEGLLVNFTDPNLKTKLASILNIPSGRITTTDMATLKVLDLSNSGITNLNGLETAVNLKELNVENNLIDTFGAASAVVLSNHSLKKLNISHNPINTMIGLQNTSTLEELNINNTNISDISFLSKTTHLEILLASFCGITSIPQFSSTDISLKILWLAGNKISDLTNFKYFYNLTDLDLSANQLTDISSLPDIPSLLSIDLNYNFLMDISPIKNILNLKQATALFQEIVLPSVTLGTSTRLNLVDLSSKNEMFYQFNSESLGQIEDRNLLTWYSTGTKSLKFQSRDANSHFSGTIYQIVTE